MALNLPDGIFEIDGQSSLGRGVRISENITIDALTRGVIGDDYPWKVAHKSDLPGYFDVIPEMEESHNALREPWQIVRNLQSLANDIIEPLIEEYGDKLGLLKAYVNPGPTLFQPEKSKHFSGEALNFYIKGYSSNMYHKAQEVCDLLSGKATAVGLVYGGPTWLHVEINGPYGKDIGRINECFIYTIDHASGQYYENVFFPTRGLDNLG